MAHPNLSTGSNDNRRHDNTESRPDRYPRPTITDPASDTEWQYFLEAWQVYKRATNLTGQSIADQLWHCPSESLKKKIFDSGVRSVQSEEQILAGIRRQCVKTHNNLVNILGFQNIQQENDETIQQFAARLNGAASVCDFTVKCKCDKEVSYKDKIQSFQLIRGLKDVDIQERILADTVNKELSLDEIIKLGEAVEVGKRSSNILTKHGDINKLSHSKQSENHSRRMCAYCHEAWHLGPNWRKACKGINSTCLNCKKKGHLAKACRSKVNKESENNMIDAADPSTPAPPQEADTASMAFFCHMQGEVVTLSHVGINEFGKWARVKIENHPEVTVQIEPDLGGYAELKLNDKMPSNSQAVSSEALVDTGAQMVVLGIDLIHNMGLGKGDLIPVGMRIKAATWVDCVC